MVNHVLTAFISQGQVEVPCNRLMLPLTLTCSFFTASLVDKCIQFMIVVRELWIWNMSCNDFCTSFIKSLYIGNMSCIMHFTRIAFNIEWTLFVKFILSLSLFQKHTTLLFTRIMPVRKSFVPYCVLLWHVHTHHFKCFINNPTRMFKFAFHLHACFEVVHVCHHIGEWTSL